MAIRDTKSNYLQKVFGKFLDYIKSRAELTYITVVEKASELISFFISGLLVFLFFMLFISFVSIFAGFWVSSMLDSFIAGFGIIALFYFLIFILLLIFRRTIIQRPLSNSIINVLFESMKNEDKNERDK